MQLTKVFQSSTSKYGATVLTAPVMQQVHYAETYCITVVVHMYFKYALCISLFHCFQLMYSNGVYGITLQLSYDKIDTSLQL
jgi:D-arabinose 5-phosphate isomerase GutQ